MNRIFQTGQFLNSEIEISSFNIIIMYSPSFRDFSDETQNDCPVTITIQRHKKKNPENASRLYLFYIYKKNTHKTPNDTL